MIFLKYSEKKERLCRSEIKGKEKTSVLLPETGSSLSADEILFDDPGVKSESPSAHLSLPSSHVCSDRDSLVTSRHTLTYR